MTITGSIMPTELESVKAKLAAVEYERDVLRQSLDATERTVYAASDLYDKVVAERDRLREAILSAVKDGDVDGLMLMAGFGFSRKDVKIMQGLASLDGCEGDDE